jgi:hypothetical protein
VDARARGGLPLSVPSAESVWATPSTVCNEAAASPDGRKRPPSRRGRSLSLGDRVSGRPLRPDRFSSRSSIDPWTAR